MFFAERKLYARFILLAHNLQSSGLKEKQSIQLKCWELKLYVKVTAQKSLNQFKIFYIFTLFNSPSWQKLRCYVTFLDIKGCFWYKLKRILIITLLRLRLRNAKRLESVLHTYTSNDLLSLKHFPASSNCWQISPQNYLPCNT